LRAVVTIKDVAKESGFAPATVSIVLNDAPLARFIPATTKARIKAAAAKLNYRPNAHARSLRSNRSHTVGVMVFDITDPYCAYILRGVEDRLNGSPYLMMLADTQNDPTRFQRAVEMLFDRRIEGIIAVANSLSLEIEVLTALTKRSIPIVVIGRDLGRSAMSTVSVNNQLGGRLALQHLHDLGHRKIAFIKGPKMLVDSAARWSGVVTFAREAGITIDSKCVLELRHPNSSYEGGFALGVEIARRHRTATAVLAFDDMTAFGVIRAMNSCSRRVPDDYSVIGFDDVAMAGCYNPSLTTVRQPMAELGSLGVELLMKSIKGSATKTRFEAAHLRVDPELVVRDSTAVLRSAAEKATPPRRPWRGLHT
jgi:LacI family transcriptional regulator